MEEQASTSHNHYEGRRATLDDLPHLRSLWQQSNLPAGELEKRFTEFQVVTNREGQIVGAAGLHVERQQGHIHSEAYAGFDDEAGIRPLLWERILRLAKNNGLLRLWTPATVSFYRDQGMVEVDDATRAKIPPGFGSPYAEWLVLKLKDETQPHLSLDQEFTLFTEQQKGEGERMMRQAQVFKLLAYLLLAVVLGALGLLVYFVFYRLPRNRNRKPAQP